MIIGRLYTGGVSDFSFLEGLRAEGRGLKADILYTIHPGCESKVMFRSQTAPSQVGFDML